MMARWRASLSSSVSSGEGGKADDPMNWSGVKVKYLQEIVFYRVKYLDEMSQRVKYLEVRDHSDLVST